MNKTVSKLALSLILLTNVNPVLAASTSHNTQLSKEVIIVAFWNHINQAIDTIKKGSQTISDIQERQRQDAERKRRQDALEQARRETTERQLQEAQRRRAYFESLSPEEKQAYIEQQNAIKQQQAAANLLILGLFADFIIGSGSESYSRQETPGYIIQENRNSTPTYQPTPVKPIHPNYGSCHSYDC
ncbi:hypothetical protein cce_2189 [Crocosphaera subtropica ATCC 51142]|uniref:Uncharacterized protein n=1 Tax=Crocosphaera subtropica (strain ATCC 51142 / BH68) TaxID=43989 RepID=B1WPG9_CROS5|nr:hypothetical protein [Crocosphaera subtropica]ACB51539.1 hypothetical protein cce_2189 [Crocosphaera subtropica ATCC 51142]